MYEAQADSIKVEDIATNDNNRIILRRMKRNNPEDHDQLYIQNQHDQDGEDCEDYVPEGAHDMGWLGYFIGKSDYLNKLIFIRLTLTPISGASIAEVLEPFFKGVNNNKSINILSFEGMDLLGGRVFSMLGPFFENCPTLADLQIDLCTLGDDGWRLLSLAIGSSKHKSLEHVELLNNDISDESMVDIITSLSIHPRLEELELYGNRISTNGCMALSTLLRFSCTMLKALNLDNNEINDEGIDALLPALKSSSHLESLSLENNSITSKGWQDISKLLCDTSSINATYLSNHTLQNLGDISNENLLQILGLNEREYEDEIAMIKILQNHNDFDMTPFFEWEFKVLPLMIIWFERASRIPMPEDCEPNIGPRKLSSIYQFVRGMPLLYVETRLRKELEEIKVLETQYQLAQERKRSIMERLDQRL